MKVLVTQISLFFWLIRYNILKTPKFEDILNIKRDEWPHHQCLHSPGKHAVFTNTVAHFTHTTLSAEKILPMKMYSRSWQELFQMAAFVLWCYLTNFWNSRLNKTYTIKFTLAWQVRTNKANEPTWSNPFSSELVLYFLSKYFFSRRWKKNNKPHHKIFRLGTTVQRFRNGFQLQQWYLSWTSSCLHITEH